MGDGVLFGMVLVPVLILIGFVIYKILDKRGLIDEIKNKIVDKLQ